MCFCARTVAQKESLANRKSMIQSRFRNELSLVVDVPKQGYGNTNPGNTARRAFGYADIFADIIGVDVRVIRRIRTILEQYAVDMV